MGLIEQDCVLLLCSDGLHGSVSEEAFVVSPPYTTTVTLSAPGNVADPFEGNSPFSTGGTRLFFPSRLGLNVIDRAYTSPYAQQWSLAVEREVARGWLAEVAYLGTKGTHLPGTRILNTAHFVAGNSTPRNIDQRRPYAPEFGQIINFESRFDSIYHSLELTGRKRLSHGLSLLAAYTWSKAIDNGSYPTGRRAIRVGTIAQDQNNLRAERGLSSFDIRHRLVVSYVWDMPLFRNRLFGGWQLNGIAAFQAGRPLVIQDGSDPNLDGVASDRPNLLRNPNLPRGRKTVDRFWDTAAFTRIPQGTNAFGNAGRNVVIGPGYANFDAALAKNFRFAERSRLEYRWEVFNVTNHPNFENPGGGTPANDIASPVFGRLQSTVPASERIMQVSLRLGF